MQRIQVIYFALYFLEMRLQEMIQELLHNIEAELFTDDLMV